MKDRAIQGMWHEMNQAQVELVLAADELVPQRRERLMEALRRTRRAEELILADLSGLGESEGAEEARGARRSRK